jgi:hypothetical protein
MMLDCVCFLPIQHFHLKRMYAGNGQLLQSDKKQLLYKHFKKLVSEAIWALPFRVVFIYPPIVQ